MDDQTNSMYGKSVQLPQRAVNNAGVIGKDFYAYSLIFTALALNTNQTKNIPIQADSDFVLQKLCFFADDGVIVKFSPNTRLIPNVTVLITDTGSGRQIMDSAVPLYSLFGTAENPFILPTPKVFSARSNISVTVANVEAAAATYTLRLAFIGTKVFRG